MGTVRRECRELARRNRDKDPDAERLIFFCDSQELSPEMSTGVELIFLSILFGLITFLPMALSNRVRRTADHLRLTNPEKLCFRASKWAYAIILMGLALSGAFIAFGFLDHGGAKEIPIGVGIIGIVLCLLSYWQLRTTRVVFEEDGLRYQRMLKDTKVLYKDIDRAHTSGGFITIRFANGKGLPMQILFEEPGKLLATIQLFAYKAKH
jgi:hypothetical protein